MTFAMKTLLVVSALLASWLGATPRCQAATPPDAESAASALVAEAARAYDQNQLDEALRLLARAYELSPRPSILYNQAQVFRTKDDCAGALDAYQRFIATTTPTDPNRERAVQRRAEMQTCVDKRRGDPGTSQAAGGPSTTEPPKPAQPPPAARVAAPETQDATPASSEATTGNVQLSLADQAPLAQAPPAVVASPSPSSVADDSGRGRRRAMRFTGWALIGASALAATAATVYAWQAHNIQEEINTGTRWTQSREDEGRRDATRARWFGAAAALAGGGGAVLLIISRPTAATEPGSTAPHAAAALVGWSGTF